MSPLSPTCARGGSLASRQARPAPPPPPAQAPLPAFRDRFPRSRARPEARRGQLAKDRLRRKCDTGVRQQQPERRQRIEPRDPLADTPHERRTRRQADRDVGAERGGDFRQRGFIHRHIPEPRQYAKGGGRIRRAAADAGRDGQVFFQCQMGARHNAGFAPQGAGGAQYEIVVFVVWPARERGGEGPGKVEREVVRRARNEPVRQRGKDHEALQQMIIVGAAAKDAECQIDLGARVLRDDSGHRVTNRPGRAPASHLRISRRLRDRNRVFYGGWPGAFLPVWRPARGSTGSAPRSCARPSTARRRDVR